MSSLGILEVVPLIAALLLSTIFGLVPVGVYVVARWREDKGGPTELNLGFVTVFGLVAYVGALLLLVGLQLSLTAVFGRANSVRPGLALLVAGALVLVPGWFALRRHLPSRAARLYLGLLTLGSAITSIFAIVLLSIGVVMNGDGAGGSIAALLTHLPVVVLGGLAIVRRPSAVVVG